MTDKEIHTISIIQQKIWAIDMMASKIKMTMIFLKLIYHLEEEVKDLRDHRGKNLYQDPNLMRQM